MDLIEEVCAALGNDQRVRRNLPGGGVINVDRLLPFLCVYRRNARRQDAGTRQFVNGEAAYLNAPGDAPVRRGLRGLVHRVAETAAERFGAFLIVEIWSAPDADVSQCTLTENGQRRLPSLKFRIHECSSNRSVEALDAMRFSLETITLHGQRAAVDVTTQSRVHPPGSHALLSTAECGRISCSVLGLEILPVYRDGENGDVFPAVVRRLHRGIGRALKKTFFAFSLNRTNVRPQHFYALGRRTVAKLVWDVDRLLSEVSGQLNLLWQVTPINAESAWQEFLESGYQREPVFQYRPLGVDPLLLKRQLNLIATERLADATLSHLFRQTQDESDRLISMLSDIGTRQFLPGSLQVFGDVEQSLLELAKRLLDQLAPSNSQSSQQLIEPRAFARQATRHLRAYQRALPAFASKTEIRDDMHAGLMVSNGNLLIGRQTIIPFHRVEALLAHEVGTHVVTYYNGRAQPLRLLSTGLAGYDALQEGLAVLAEYLVGGLSEGRLRVLAARVVAVNQLLNRATFAETFRLLVEDYHFEPRVAYTISLRVFRGGGLTKDAVYLRGLVEILEYLRRGGDFARLFVGKLSVDHVPIIRELQLREVLRPAPLTPHYLTLPGVSERLERARRGLSVLDLVTP